MNDLWVPSSVTEAFCSILFMNSEHSENCTVKFQLQKPLCGQWFYFFFWPTEQRIAESYVPIRHVVKMWLYLLSHCHTKRKTCSGLIILSSAVECCCIHSVINVKFSLFTSLPQLLGRTHDVFWDCYCVAVLLMNFVFLNCI